MIFSSLQVLRNTYKYNFNTTNAIFKSNYNLYILLFLYKNLIISNLFTFDRKSLKQFSIIKTFYKKKIKIKHQTRFLVNSFCFFSANWVLYNFTIIFLHKNRPSLRAKKKRKKFKLKRLLLNKFF